MAYIYLGKAVLIFMTIFMNSCVKRTSRLMRRMATPVVAIGLFCGILLGITACERAVDLTDFGERKLPRKSVPMCNPQSPNIRPGDSASLFSGTLAKEYTTASSMMARRNLGKARSLFARKAMEACMMRPPLYEDETRWNIPVDFRPSISKMRENLERVFSSDCHTAYPADLAKLQARYDCAIAEAEVDVNGNVICQAAFYDILNRMDVACSPPPPIVVTPPPPPPPPLRDDSFDTQSGRAFMVYFDTGNADPKHHDDIVARMNSYLHSRGAYRIEVLGHADTVGGNPVNDKLSAKRAKNVKTWLVKEGFDERLIKTASYGKRKNAIETPDGIPQRFNRRAVILITDESKK